MLSAFQKDNALNSERSQLFEKLTLSKVHAFRFFKIYRFQFEFNVLTIN
jgi:hypothetical protein